MVEYRPPRVRDAFGVIRGFVFQVDLTVARWLDLKPDQTLELELGEDIDVAANAVAGDDHAARILEQVKHRERSITLRDPAAVEAIANAIEHADHNPELQLQFQFTTNAVAGTERPSLPAIKGSAINAWEQLRTGARIGRDGDLTFEAIRTILAERPKPDGYPDKEWIRFREVVTAADLTELRRIVATFSWCLRVPPSPVLRDRMIANLVESGEAKSIDIATHQYRRVFMHVLDLLSSPGRKRLVATDLRSILALPAIRESEQRSLDLVFQRIDGLEERLTAVAQQQAADREDLDARIDALAHAQGVTAAVRHLVSTPTLRPPPPPSRYCRRRPTVKKLLPLLAKCRWLELYGTIGFGKSEVARLLGERAGGIRAWIDLRGLEVSEAAMRLDAATEMITGRFRADRRALSYSEFISRVGQGAVVVVDDLPERTGRDALSERLLELVVACEANGVRLISTTTTASPTSITDRIPKESYVAHAAPPFGDTEITALLAAFGAPPEVSKKGRRLIRHATGGHPTLLVAAARYLEGQHWQLAKHTLLDLLGGSYAASMRRETVKTLIERVADASTREMLYRLNLAITTFSEADATDIAAVPQAIDRPVERLQSLIDVAIQRSPSGDLRVSPLFRILGSGDVPADSQAGCHIALGRAIMRRKTVGIDEAAAAVTRFLAGKDPNRAAIVLLRGLSSLVGYRGRVDGDPLTMFWANAPMPASIDRGLRIAVRATQIQLLRKMGHPFAYALEEIETTIREAHERDAWAVLTAGITLNIVFWKRDLRRANRYLLMAIDAIPKVEKLTRVLTKTLTKLPEELFWTTASQVKTTDDLEDWVRSVDQLPAERRERLFRSDLSDGGCWRLPDAVWLHEADKPESERNWTSIARSLDALADAGRRWGQAVLAGCAARSRIVVRAEYLRDLPGAVSLAREVLAGLSVPKAQYPVRECVGRQYIYAGMSTEGLAWLIASLADAGEEWAQERIGTTMHIAANASTPAEALIWVERAVSIARADATTPQLMLARVIGELALALWDAGERDKMVGPLDESLTHLVAAKRDAVDELWRSVVGHWGHNAAYMVSQVVTGRPPDHAADGGRFARPRLGALMHHNKAVAEWLPPARVSHLFAMVAILAEDRGDDEIAARRALEALDYARDEHNLLTLSNMGHRHAVSLVLTGRLPDAMDFALASSAGFEALRAIELAGADLYQDNRTIEEILGPKPSDAWSKAESFSLLFAAVPAALYLARTALKDPHLASLKAAEIIAAAKTIGQQASDPQLWANVADVFDRAFVNPRAGGDLIDFGNQLKARDRTSLQCVAYLGATLRSDCRPTDAVIAHVYLAGEATVLVPDRTIHRRLFVPFLQEYWERVVREERFRFSPPSLTMEAFQRALSVPSPQRPQAILRAILQGLHVPAPEKYRAWLLSGK
ncbi:MAG TPA: hypothetical protein VGI81_15520 [Tepidisphaeraceae bacterium]|jgi:hypothetical protein